VRTCRRVVVGGRVQAVGFRATCAREAQRAGVAGWVTNRGDRKVEALFEGDADAVDAMVAWMRQGPPGARVETHQTTEEQPGDRPDFRIG
jgi:acylphosphatase